MMRLPMHEALKPIAWLEGIWKTEPAGRGIYPTITPFNYCEELNFSSIGQPMFNYTAQSWHADGGKPLHRETGLLKIIPGTTKVSFLLAHNFGVTTIEEGEIGDKIINFKTTNVSRPTEGTKMPCVLEVCLFNNFVPSSPFYFIITFQQLRREFRLIGDRLQHILSMATSTTPEITEHLRATYVKQCDKNE